MNKTAASLNQFQKKYSMGFSIVVLIVLVAFIPLPVSKLFEASPNFRLRQELISLYCAFRLSVGDRLFNQTLAGNDGWFYFTGEFSVEDYQGLVIIRPAKLNRIQKNLDRLNADLMASGVTLMVVIPPDKSTIYPQYIPGQIQVTEGPSRLDQFLEHMRSNSSTPILDLRPLLTTASQSQDVYYKTDTHWNDIGAFHAYQGIMNYLVSFYPMLEPNELSDYIYTSAGASTHDLPLLMGLQKYLEADWILIPDFEIQLEETSTTLPDGRSIRTVINSDGQLPQLLVFGDSFYVSLARFLEPNFSRTKTIPFTFESDVWSLEWIKRENPDIVIIEIVERALDISLSMLLENWK